MNETVKETPLEIIPYSANLITQAQRYTDLMHLPKEAISAVIRTLDNYNKLVMIIDRQKKLPYEQRRLLVDTKSPLAEHPLE